MSYSEWKSVRDSAISACNTVDTASKFSNINSASFDLSDEFNRLLDSEIEKVFGFITSHQLSNQVNVSQLEQLFQRRGQVSGGFGSGTAGLAKKFSTIHLLVEKIDRIYDRELKTVEKVEHALLVLDRKLFLLKESKKQWSSAFKNRSEVKLEELGGLHLFECGIWGFKAQGQNSATDLILQHQVTPSEVTVPFVMTEWKKASNQNDANTKLNQALRQCEIYQNAILKPLELDKHRFIVIITKTPVDLPKEREHQGKKYLIRNIAINRRVPSREARSRT